MNGKPMDPHSKLIPRVLYEENRVRDICDAIIWCKTARVRVPSFWVEELCDLVGLDIDAAPPGNSIAIDGGQ